MSRLIRTGEVAKLRVQFFDDAGVPTDVDNPVVSLLEPDETEPTIEGLIPVSLGNGIYEVTITGLAPAGFWNDKWEADLLGSAVVAQFNYHVVDSGFASIYPDFGFFPNSLITIELTNDILSLEGDTLVPTTIEFTNELSPFYSSVRKVKREIGTWINGVDDLTISLNILEASIEADILTFRKHCINNPLYQHARREYVTAVAAELLLVNDIPLYATTRKALSDFEVEYDAQAIQSALEKIREDIKKWEAQLQTGGNARNVRRPQGFVKGQDSGEYPTAGRLWEDGQIPAVNDRYKSPYKRFSQGSYKYQRRGRGNTGW